MNMTPRKRKCARRELTWIELPRRFAPARGVDTDTMMRRTFKVGDRVRLRSGGLPGTDVATIRQIHAITAWNELLQKRHVG
jgi:hypothetical protein